MQKMLCLFTIGLLLFGCKKRNSKNDSGLIENETAVSNDELSKIGRSNYAVVWEWATEDVALVKDNTPAISQELNNLWKNDVVENAYYDTDSPIDKLDHYPNITFFTKAHSRTEAESNMDALTIVKKGIATYTLYPVGQLWLDRKSDVITKNGITNSYVAVWTTNKSPQEGTNAGDLIKTQNDAMLDLWKKGRVENVYFNIEGTYQDSDKTDFVFFVNANTENEAEEICNTLPFAKENIASYKLHRAGTFWMGKYKK